MRSGGHLGDDKKVKEEKSLCQSFKVCLEISVYSSQYYKNYVYCKGWRGWGGGAERPKLTW